MPTKSSGYLWVLLAIALTGSCSCSAHTVTRCDVSAIPDSIQSVIHRQFADWAVVKIGDLRLEDQVLWRKNQNNTCPGIAIGHFQASSATSYAVTLFKGGERYQQVLLVGTLFNNKPLLEILSEPQPVAYLSVVRRISQGTKIDGIEKPLDLDAVAYETIEAGIIIYYYDGQRYSAVQPSE